MVIEKINKEIEKIEKNIKGKHDNGLYGTIVDKYIKCGKENCKCAQGYRHGPYPHLQLYVNGKLKTFYIKKSDKRAYEKKLKENKKFRKNIKRLINLYEKKRLILGSDNNWFKGTTFLSFSL